MIGEEQVILQIALVILTAVLPGRVVRRGLIALKREMEYKKTFVRYISHEVRSPLSTISLGIDCLLETTKEQLTELTAQLSSQEGQQLGPSELQPDKVAEGESALVSQYSTPKNSVYGQYSTNNGTDTKERTNEANNQAINQLLVSSDTASEASYSPPTANHHAAAAATAAYLQAIKDIDELGRDCKVACNLAVQTLNDLLLYDKIESRMVSLETSVVPCKEFIDDVIHPFYMLCHAANIHFQANYDDTSTVIDSQQHGSLTSKLIWQIDKHKVEQVMRNFLTNAIKFTPKHGFVSVQMKMQSDFTVRPSAAQRKQQATPIVRWEVTDTGAGISEVSRLVA